MKNILRILFSSVSVMLTLFLHACTQPEDKLDSEKETFDANLKSNPVPQAFNNDEENVCGGTPRDYPEYPPFNAPSYKKTSSAMYNYTIDENIFRFSPLLTKWVINRTQESMNGFEKEVLLAEISERTASWKITALTHNIANVENSIFTRSSRFPKGATVRYTYLYNRGTETRHEIQHLFSDKKTAELKLKRILLDELVVFRAKALDISKHNDDLISETKDKLPDGVFGYLDVELYQLQNSNKFEGIKISIDENPPWNWFPEGGYDIVIDVTKFSSLLKPKCRVLFSSTL